MGSGAAGPVGPGTSLVVVDDEAIITDVLSRRLARDGYTVITASSAAEARARVAESRPAVLLADIQMPGESGLDLLAWARRYDPDLAVIMITALGAVSAAVQALRAGAADYILKPFNLEQVSIAVRRALERRQALITNRAYREGLEAMVAESTRAHAEAVREIQATYDATLRALGAALSYREGSSPHHSRRVAAIAGAIAQRLALAPAERDALERAALLHDIGKIAIPDAILTKPGRLTEEEYAVMRNHPRKGYELLSRIRFLRPAAEIVYAHQERYDGSGYPRGLAGEAIPLGARILAVANAYDAMTAGRHYQPRLADTEARERLRAGAGSHFDPRVVEAFLSIPPEELPPPEPAAG
ncbi:MAG TPA: HD domain-containing phosphohydrolase [Thermodesulfobacteriota bacterium]|nr:HD domain-containing phosphohydrolase [Thermodesulfobacteriota bacterium]